MDDAPLVEPEPTPPVTPASPEAQPPRRTGDRRALSKWVWQGRYSDAFWKGATLFSFVVNLILLLVVFVLGYWLFDIKSKIVGPLITDLHRSFVAMDTAHIRTTIQVNDQIQVQDAIPVVFDLPLKQQTIVTLITDTRIPNTLVNLNGIPIPTDIVLPAGTPLYITLDLTVPVRQTIPILLTVPISITVPVDIPLEETELHEPFARLQSAVAPYDSLLATLPETWDEALCQYARLCFFAPK